MPQPDGSQKAIGLHIFMAAQRGVVPTRFLPWDREPGSTMTNADVASSVAGVDGQIMMVKYSDGEKKVIVPSNTPVVGGDLFAVVTLSKGMLRSVLCDPITDGEDVDALLGADAGEGVESRRPQEGSDSGPSASRSV
jgi:hypothetical protein